MCEKQILRVADLQSEDYHLDRQVYYACRMDREKLCSDVKAGEGQVYKCLFSKKEDGGMSHKVWDVIWAVLWENHSFTYAKTKTQMSFMVTAELINVFVYTT